MMSMAYEMTVCVIQTTSKMSKSGTTKFRQQRSIFKARCASLYILSIFYTETVNSETTKFPVVFWPLPIFPTCNNVISGILNLAYMKYDCVATW